ncbi:MAG: zinc-dependent metalloprotease [Bacteroidota bacterium]
MKKLHLLLLVAASTFSSTAIYAQKKDDKAVVEPAKPAAPASATIADKVKRCKKIDGLFTLYRDTTSGTLFLLIKKDQLNKEFIYFSYVENGNTTTGHNKGTFRDNKIFKINKYYNQLEFITQNTGFYFDEKSNLSKAADANISNAIMASEKIVATDEAKGEYLIEADNLLLSEVLYQIKTPTSPAMAGQSFNLGMLSRSKTRYQSIKNYPANTDIIVKYVYDDPASRGTGSEAITDGRYVEIQLQHSFIEMPDDAYEPRMDDPRVGYFMTQINDMTTTSALNYKDLIHRWRLVKKDKDVLLSEPVKPITWWIEKTTPAELRPTIKAAILQWNIAFEKAGFKNAVQIFEQPDTATWEAGDIRYNVLRWTSSPEPPFGGYGPSFVNPRTGEILGADIMLEWVFITNRLRSQKVFDKAGMEWLFDEHLEENHSACMAGDYLHSQNLLGLQMLAMSGASEIEVNDFIKESLYYLILHEVGHTLGLNHNMKATQMYSTLDLYDINKTRTTGLIGSVMDYPAVNFSNKKGIKCQYYTDRPGPYDLWAIEFGYYEESTKVLDEARRAKILARSTEPQLCFGNDADDMRSPGKAIDPRVMIGDMSSDAIGFARERIALIKTLQSNLLSEYGKDDRSYQELRGHYLILTGEWAVQAGVMSRYIGGVYVDRSFSNQSSTVKPFTAVPYETQKLAMKSLAELVFAPTAMELPTDLAAYLQMQRRGYNFFGGGEDPKLHDRVLNVQRSVLMHLLHPTTLERLTDSKMYGNKYELGEMMKDLTNSIFQADLATPVNSYRQNLQIEYVKILTMIINMPMYDNISRAKATAQLQSIQKQMQTALVTSTGDTKEHRNYIILLTKQALDVK